MTDFLSPFSAWSGPRKPKMLLIGEAFGESEDQLKQPFVGESGKEFWRILGEAAPDLWPEEHSRVADLHRYGLAWARQRDEWLHEAEIAFTNVLNLRPPANKLDELCVPKKDLSDATYPWPAISRGLYLRPEFLPHIERLLTEIRLASPNLIVTLGNTACWAILRRTDIGAIRGTTTLAGAHVSPLKTLPIYHPASVLYRWSWRPIVIADLMKAFRESKFPELRRPARQVLVNGTITEYQEWTDAILHNHPPKMLSCDIETGHGLIKCVGFGSGAGTAIVVPFRDAGLAPYWPDTSTELAAWQVVFDLLASPIPKLFQNGLYDLQYLLKLGCRPCNVIEDSMLLHHALYPEMQKGLGFLGSIYTDEPAWKLMRRKRPDTEKRDE